MLDFSSPWTVLGITGDRKQNKVPVIRLKKKILLTHVRNSSEHGTHNNMFVYAMALGKFLSRIFSFIGETFQSERERGPDVFFSSQGI